MATNKKTASSKTKKKKIVRKIDKGQCHIQSSFNNTLITFTDTQGNAISWSSSGKMGLRGSKNQHLLRLNFVLKMLQKWQRNTESNQSTCLLKDRATAGKVQFVQFKLLKLK